MIKIVLVLGIVAVAISMLRNRNAMRFRAGKKLLLAAFTGLAILAVVFPTTSNDAAQAIGVGRGADLLLYLLIVAFLFVALNTYLKFKDYDSVITRLSRRIALDEAERRYGSVSTAHRGHPPVDPDATPNPTDGS